MPPRPTLDWENEHRWKPVVKTHKLVKTCKQILSVFSSCPQVAFALLIPCCWKKFEKTVNNPLTSLIGTIRLVTRLSNTFMIYNNIVEALPCQRCDSRVTTRFCQSCEENLCHTMKSKPSNVFTRRVNQTRFKLLRGDLLVWHVTAWRSKA